MSTINLPVVSETNDFNGATPCRGSLKKGLKNSAFLGPIIATSKNKCYLVLIIKLLADWREGEGFLLAGDSTFTMSCSPSPPPPPPTQQIPHNALRIYTMGKLKRLELVMT